jgi:alkylation response protein AidB-like acyl-CoA dehydrogenase
VDAEVNFRKTEPGGLQRRELEPTVFLSEDHQRFRREVCDFLSSRLTADVRRANHDPDELGGWSVEFRRRFKRQLAERGYIGVGWPVAYGGRGLDMVYEVILADELEYHDAPALDPSVGYIPYALLAFANDNLKSRFLPALRRAEISMFLAYSEPEAGSDLANLSTRAEREGDEYVITGQKSYSSYSHFAQYAFLAARTSLSDRKHHGITLFIVDLAQPGVSISRHRTISGSYHHSVYFDHVRTPASMIVGTLDEGWKVLMGAIDYERAAIGSPGLVDRQLDRLVSLCLRDPHYVQLGNDPIVADRLVSLAIEADAARLYAYMVAQAHANGERPQHETSVCVLLKRETARLAEALAVDLLGPEAQLTRAAESATLEGAVDREYREHIFFRFAAGGFDITRNVIATRGLGMAR